MSDLIRDINRSEHLTICWLQRAFEVTQEKGISHSRRNYLPGIIAWRKAYPETTGFLIENLLRTNSGSHPQSIEIGIKLSEWLVKIQNEDGSYNSGISLKTPSFFNTGQILFGLVEAYEYSKNAIYLNSVNLAYDWLLNALDHNGICYKGLYTENLYQSYYSRALWPMIKCKLDNLDRINQSLQFLAEAYQKNGLSSFSFYNTPHALTHTIAYGLEGFLESGRLLNNSSLIELTIKTLDQFAEQIQQTKLLGAEYDNQFRNQSNYCCTTGQAQFISLFCKAYQISQNSIYKEIAIKLIKELMSWQIKSTNKDHNGALYASHPKSGNYFPYQYVNWTHKFYLDACYEIKKIL